MRAIESRREGTKSTQEIMASRSDRTQGIPDPARSQPRLAWLANSKMLPSFLEPPAFAPAKLSRRVRS